MKLSTRLLCLLLITATLFTFAGCHKKNETVMTVGDVAIPSGLYLAFQLEGYNQLMDGVYTQLEATSATSELTAYADYFNYEYEGKTAEQYIYDYAETMAIEYALIQSKFTEYGLELSKEESDYIEASAEYYWEQQDKYTYEPSGVGYETYKELTAFYTKKSLVFDYYYNKKNEETGKGGLYTVSDKELTEKLASDFILADSLYVSLTPEDSTDTTGYTDDQIKEIKETIDGYAERINKGERFSDVHKEATGSAPSTTVTATEEGPNTIYSNTAVVYSSGDSDTTTYDLFNTAKDIEGFEYGKAYVVGGEADGAYHLVILYEIAKDEYYLEQQRTNLLYLLRDEDFTAKLEEEGKALTVTKDNGLIKYYKPTNIDFDKIASENA